MAPANEGSLVNAVEGEKSADSSGNRTTCSCCPVSYFGTLFWDDITKFWDENLSLFTFLTGKLRKNLF